MIIRDTGFSMKKNQNINCFNTITFIYNYRDTRLISSIPIFYDFKIEYTHLRHIIFSK
jgi:hypothetical protein